jgi:hypothetical protein
MANLIDYLKTSNECEQPIEQVATSQFLKENYFKIGETKKNSLINFLFISNFCFAFKSKPIIYEQLTQYMSDKFNVNKTNIVLIGSAKTGFAVDPSTYGKSFSENSDLDFAIIDRVLYENCVKNFKLWKIKTENNEYTESQKNRFWSDSQNNLKYQIKKGFIDTYKIPNFYEFETTQRINQSLSLIVLNLERYQNIKVKEASARIYKDWESFQKQLRLNIQDVLGKI